MSSITQTPLEWEEVVGYKKERYGLRSPKTISKPTRANIVGKPTPPPSQEEIERCNNAREVATTAKALNESSMKLSRLLDEQVFIAESLSFLTSKMPRPEHRPTQGHGSRDLDYGDDMNYNTDEERRSLAARTRDALLTRDVLLSTLRALSSLVLNMPPSPSTPGFPEDHTPAFFLRAFKSSNHSPHDKIFGFRSSKQPSTPPDYRASTLKESSYLNARMFRNHCEKTEHPSDLIAISDSPARILKFVIRWDFKDMEGKVIAVISASKLQRMGVLFNRTTTLARHLEIPITRSERVEYVHENYWVAYRWIPVECIERYLTLSDLIEICARRGIGTLIPKRGARN